MSSETEGISGSDQNLVNDVATAQVAQDNLRIARQAFTWAMFGAMVVLTLLIIANVVIMFVVAMGQWGGVDKSLIARLLQIAYGMVIGSACLFLGVILCWFGISASFAVSAKGGANVRFALSSASPGIALILSGMILVGMTLLRPINYFEDVGGTMQRSIPGKDQ